MSMRQRDPEKMTITAEEMKKGLEEAEIREKQKRIKVKEVYIDELLAVMDRAEKKWSLGDLGAISWREHDDQKGEKQWCEEIIAYSHWASMMVKMQNSEKFRKRMLQIAGLAIHSVMSHDRRMGESKERLNDMIKNIGKRI